MAAAFAPRLLNPPFGDPGLYVGLRHQGRAMLFDLGRIDRQPAAALLKIGHVFVSHTHMDHFIGFDHLLRIFLARELHLDIFGPPGIIDNVRGKLAGYTWNLIESYPFTLTVHEVGAERIDAVHLPARTAFAPEPLPPRSFDGVLVDTPQFTVTTVHLDHRIPCLGFALAEKTRLNVRPERLAALGVSPGPWLNRLKDGVRDGLPDETPIDAAFQGVHLKDGFNRVRLAFHGNLPETATNAEELVLARVRHHKGEGGRADLLVTAGDVPSGKVWVVSECWSAGLGSTYRFVRECPGDGIGGDRCVNKSQAGDVSACLGDLAQPELPPAEPEAHMDDPESPEEDLLPPSDMPSGDAPTD